MTCKEFESGMRSQFGSVDREEWKLRVTRENWDGLPSFEAVAHLTKCSDCQTSLFQFLDVRDFLAYESYPCFHIAYYCADTPDRCVDVHLGIYAILMAHKNGPDGITIPYCPWCGIYLHEGGQKR